MTSAAWCFDCLVMLAVLGVAGVVSGATGVLIGEVVDDATGRPLPARVYVTGSDGKPYLALPGPGQSIAHYDVTRGSREVYTAVGAHPFRVELPPGTVTVTVERGKEYMPVTRELAIGEARTLSEQFRLQRMVDLAARGWYSGDLHVHTPLKDLPVMQLADDLNVAFPITAWATDDTMAPANREGKVPERGELVSIDDTHVYWTLNTEYELFTARGLEGQGMERTLGAIMFLGHKTPFTQTAPPIGPIADEARRQGAIIDWDKHCWPWSAMLVPVAGIETIELSNNHMWRLKPHFLLWGLQPPEWMGCSNDAAGWASYGFQAYYALLNSGFTLRPSAGTANGVHPVPLGHSRVYVKLDGPFRYDRWVEGLRQGRSFVTNGPVLLMTVDGMQPGERKRIPEGQTVTVNVTVEVMSLSRIERIEIVVNGKVASCDKSAQEAPAGGPHHHRTECRVDVTGSTWIAARCFSAAPPDNVCFAHTGPVFFDDPARPLRPEPRQIGWLIDTVTAQLERVNGKLAPEAVAEYHKALDAYQRASR